MEPLYQPFSCPHPTGPVTKGAHGGQLENGGMWHKRSLTPRTRQSPPVPLALCQKTPFDVHVLGLAVRGVLLPQLRSRSALG